MTLIRVAYYNEEQSSKVFAVDERDSYLSYVLTLDLLIIMKICR